VEDRVGVGPAVPSPEEAAEADGGGPGEFGDVDAPGMGIPEEGLDLEGVDGVGVAPDDGPQRLDRVGGLRSGSFFDDLHFHPNFYPTIVSDGLGQGFGRAKAVWKTGR
jgi:hypothetical protein